MTKKFLISFSEKGIRETRKNEFLVPNFLETNNKFIGTETGKNCQYGFVVYTGVDLNPDMVIEKLIKSKIISKDDPKIAETINNYLLFLKTCKIGDVIEIINEDGQYKYKITGLRPKVQTSKIP